MNFLINFWIINTLFPELRPFARKFIKVYLLISVTYLCAFSDSKALKNFTSDYRRTGPALTPALLSHKKKKKEKKKKKRGVRILTLECLILIQ